MKTLTNILMLGSVLCLSACASDSYLQHRTIPERADYGDEAIHVDPAAPEDVQRRVRPSLTTLLPAEITGTWTFTTPPTVTRIEKRTGTFDQFSLYNGIPKPEDRPFLLITVSPDRKSLTESDPATYKVSSTREYILNGNIAQEWTGLTDAGAGFCELIVRKPGTAGQTGDVCHATAIARNEEEQKVALSILASIVWKSSR